MAREYRMRPDAVVERRLALADRPKVVSPDSRSWGTLATLPPGETSDDERLWARRAVARHSMLKGHGCAGKRCRRKQAHWHDEGVLGELLAVLGLGGESR